MLRTTTRRMLKMATDAQGNTIWDLAQCGFTATHVGDGDFLIKGMIAGEVRELFLAHDAIMELAQMSKHGAGA